MLQVVRDFALEQLDALGETEQLRRAHADYQGVIIAAEPMLRRDPRPVIEQYRADLPNIRATLRWSLGEGGRPRRPHSDRYLAVSVDRRASERER